VPHSQALAGRCAATGKLRLDYVLAPDKNESGVRIVREILEDRRHRNVRTVVATHAVDGNRHVHRISSHLNPRPVLFAVSSRLHEDRQSALVFTTFLPR
jgi:hypothetical protein